MFLTQLAWYIISLVVVSEFEMAVVDSVVYASFLDHSC